MDRITILLLLLLGASFDSVNNESIKLDGKISKAEWRGAKEYDLNSGGKLFILQRDETLFLGIKGYSPGWAHVYLSWSDSVNEKGSWKLQKKFSWELREFEYDNKLVQKQESYYSKNGWCSNNNNAGDKTTLEYKIDLRRFGVADVKYAALYTSDAKSLSTYPPALNDDSILEKLVSGSSPDNLQFRPQTWIKINQ